MAGPKEQPLPPDVIGRDDATEVLRAFVLDGGLSIAFTRAFEEPDMWGLLLVDIARHAARAYARESDYTEEEALARIVDMFEAEIARPTDMGTTTPRSQTGSLTVAVEPYHFDFMAEAIREAETQHRRGRLADRRGADARQEDHRARP